MSLRIIKPGILDTVQDTGRYGYQHLGINPNGAMDRYSAQLSNALLGKDLNAAVIELHFPASQILFEKETLFCICGADFLPTINELPIPMGHPVVASGDSILRFQNLLRGSRCYISLLNDMKLDRWMKSYSTNLKISAGGWMGRALAKNDQLHCMDTIEVGSLLKGKQFSFLPWKANETVEYKNEIEFIIGSEWYWLTREAQQIFRTSFFQISNHADRMGYRLMGPELMCKDEEQLVSSAVSFGTVQLLPSGQLIILMADHQTTGGYPRIAHVISAHLPILAQKKANDVIQFQLTDLKSAEEKMIRQQKYLREIQIACKFRLENLLNAS